MLGFAKLQLRQILEALRPYIAEGVPIVGLEPSCTAVFRDELTNLFPSDEDARRLNNQAYVPSEFLEKEYYRPPKLERKAVVRNHCQHKAIMRMSDEEKVLKKLGLDFEVLDSGCCGMVESWGYEKGEHYDASMKAGERILLPAVRGTDKDALILTDLLLPLADKRGHRPPCSAPCAGSTDGPARRRRVTEQLPRIRILRGEAFMAWPARHGAAGGGSRTNRRCCGLNREESGRVTTL